MAKTLDDLIAESEIKDLHVRYCRANDRRDEALIRGCFHSDAVIELHESLGVDAFVGLWRAVLGHYAATWHNVANQLVEVDGDAAWAEHYTISTHRHAADAAGPERDFVASGRYIDRCERRDGEWRIARRTMLVDLMRTDPVPPPERGFDGTRFGSHGLDDPSYALRLRA